MLEADIKKVQMDEHGFGSRHVRVCCAPKCLSKYAKIYVKFHK